MIRICLIAASVLLATQSLALAGPPGGGPRGGIPPAVSPGPGGYGGGYRPGGYGGGTVHVGGGNAFAASSAYASSRTTINVVGGGFNQFNGFNGFGGFGIGVGFFPYPGPSGTPAPWTYPPRPRVVYVPVPACQDCLPPPCIVPNYR